MPRARPGDDFGPRDLVAVLATARVETAELNSYTELATATDGLTAAVSMIDGELAGVPFAVKDNIDVAGFATRAASPAYPAIPVERDAGVVGALRAAGAIPIGKTNMHELAFGITSNNAYYGPVRNPYDRDRVAGGSSGGSAATVARGTVPFALGTDTGGSITIPAAFCGVVGYRPSVGRYPADGLLNLSTTRDTVGIHARAVDVVARIDRVITGRSPHAGLDAESVRIGVPRSRYSDLAPEVAEAAERALDRLRHAGVSLVDVEIDDDQQLSAGPGMDIVLYEAAPLLLPRSIATTIAELAELVASPDVAGIVSSLSGHPIDDARYARAQAARRQLRRRYAEVFARRGVDVILGPNVPVLPPLIGQDDTIELNGREVSVFPAITRLTAPGTTAGVPMLSIPAGRRGRLPVGMLLEGAPDSDEHLLAVAGAISTILGDSR